HLLPIPSSFHPFYNHHSILQSLGSLEGGGWAHAHGQSAARRERGWACGGTRPRRPRWGVPGRRRHLTRPTDERRRWAKMVVVCSTRRANSSSPHASLSALLFFTRATTPGRGGAAAGTTAAGVGRRPDPALPSHQSSPSPGAPFSPARGGWSRARRRRLASSSGVEEQAVSPAVPVVAVAHGGGKGRAIPGSSARRGGGSGRGGGARGRPMRSSRRESGLLFFEAGGGLHVFPSSAASSGSIQGGAAHLATSPPFRRAGVTSPRAGPLPPPRRCGSAPPDWTSGEQRWLQELARNGPRPPPAAGRIHLFWRRTASSSGG
ncbi:unnamed protein product, partial [Urochloa humidicola]